MLHNYKKQGVVVFPLLGLIVLLAGLSWRVWQLQSIDSSYLVHRELWYKHKYSADALLDHLCQHIALKNADGVVAFEREFDVDWIARVTNKNGYRAYARVTPQETKNQYAVMVKLIKNNKIVFRASCVLYIIGAKAYVDYYHFSSDGSNRQ